MTKTKLEMFHQISSKNLAENKRRKEGKTICGNINEKSMKISISVKI